MRECPTCHEQTPEGHFCVRCGAPLDQELDASRHRTQFAAAPGENRYAPWVISTLFPHLPRHSERHFRFALILGAAAVIVLGVLRLFPIALITAAALMPLLTVLYFYDVDIYEGEPAWSTAFSLVWGAVMGVGVGLLAKAVAPTGTSLINKGSTAHVVTGGVLIPALGVLVMLVGPLVLLGYRRHDETLDGATFGAATAATFSAAEAIVVGVDVLKGGVRPAGAILPWLERLVAIAIATPVLSMAAIGSATAALWLRYRAPIKDRGALGAVGHPALAIPLAALLVIAGAIGETFMPTGVWLIWLVVLDLVALVLLRRAIHVGLLEESAEREIGPEIKCANCGETTASHTFCGNCGIALEALPKAEQRGSFAGRLGGQEHRRSGGRRLIAYGAALAAFIGVAFVVAILAAPGPVKPTCPPGVPCGAPPVAPRATPTFPGYTPWTSTGLGYTLRYTSNDFSVANQNADALELQAADGFSVMIIEGAPTSQATPSELINARLSNLKGELLGLTSDPSPGDQVLGPQVGLTPGVGGVYTATVTSPQGPQAPVSIAIMAATNGTVTIAVTLITPGDDQNDKLEVSKIADDVVDSIQWAGS
jgi:ribosomal protein L32